jgi:hypothetical protein
VARPPAKTHLHLLIVAQQYAQLNCARCQHPACKGQSVDIQRHRAARGWGRRSKRRKFFKIANRADVAGSEAVAEEFVRGGAGTEDEPIDKLGGEKLIQEEEDQAAEAAGAIAASVSNLALVEEMLEIARKHGNRPDARIRRLEEWIRANMAPDGRWNERRLVLFTEYEDTRRWVEKRLAEALDDLQTDDRIASFAGATPLVRREELKCRFNADPQKESVADPRVH